MAYMHHPVEGTACCSARAVIETSWHQDKIWVVILMLTTVTLGMTYTQNVIAQKRSDLLVLKYNAGSGSFDKKLPFDEFFLIKGDLPVGVQEVLVCARHRQLKYREYKRYALRGDRLQSICTNAFQSARVLSAVSRHGHAGQHIAPVGYWRGDSAREKFDVRVSPLPGRGVRSGTTMDLVVLFVTDINTPVSSTGALRCLFRHHDASMIELMCRRIVSQHFYGYTMA